MTAQCVRDCMTHSCEEERKIQRMICLTHDSFNPPSINLRGERKRTEIKQRKSRQGTWIRERSFSDRRSHYLSWEYIPQASGIASYVDNQNLTQESLPLELLLGFFVGSKSSDSCFLDIYDMNFEQLLLGSELTPIGKVLRLAVGRLNQHSPVHYHTQFPFLQLPNTIRRIRDCKMIDAWSAPELSHQDWRHGPFRELICAQPTTITAIARTIKVEDSVILLAIGTVSEKPPHSQILKSACHPWEICTPPATAQISPFNALSPSCGLISLISHQLKMSANCLEYFAASDLILLVPN